MGGQELLVSCSPVLREGAVFTPDRCSVMAPREALNRAWETWGVEGRYHFISFSLLILSLIANIYIEEWGFPGYSKEPAWQCRRRKRRGFDPWAGKIPWRRV